MFEHINVKKYINLDINQYNDMVLWNVQQGDHRTRVLEFNITNSGLNYIVPKGTFAQITWVKPDNTMIIEDSATQNSDLTTEKTDSSTIVTYKLSDNAVAVPGICEFKIKLLLYTDDGKGGYTTEVLSTVKGKIRVNKDVVNNDTVISTTEYKSAENIIGEGRDMLDSYYNVAEKIENKVSECTTVTNECKDTTDECKKVIASAGTVKSVNGISPDDNGNVEVEVIDKSDLILKDRTPGYQFMENENYSSESNTLNLQYYSSNNTPEDIKNGLSEESYWYISPEIDTKSLYIDTTKPIKINFYNFYSDTLLYSVFGSVKGFSKDILTTFADLKGAKIIKRNDSVYLYSKDYKIPKYVTVDKASMANYAEAIKNVRLKYNDNISTIDIVSQGGIDIDPIIKSVNSVKKVNGRTPDENGNVRIETGTISNVRLLGDNHAIITDIENNGEIDLRPLFSSIHQDISGKQDKSTAVTHTASTAVGSESKGVYVNADGVATPMKYSVNKDVPSDAVFTDTTYSEVTISKAGLIPALSGNSEQYLNGNGEWTTPPSSSSGTPSVYQEKITKTSAKTPFELTQSNVDSSKCYFKYYGNSDIYEPELHVYLASGVSFDLDTQYIIPCSIPLFSERIDLTLNDSTDYVLKDDENSYGGYKLYLYSNDEILIACWDSYNSSSSSVKSTYMNYLDFIDTAQFCYYVKNGDSTYIATSLSEITGDYLIGTTEILIPYAGGYLYEDSEGGAIDFLLNCANNNNALSIRMYKFGVTTSPSAGIGQDISLKANTKYKFSACVKVVSGTVTNIGLNITSSNASSSGIGGAKELTITNGKVSYEFVTGSDLTNFKRCYVYNGKTNQATSRQVLLYNMMIKEI